MKPFKLLSFFIVLFLFSFKMHAQEATLYNGSPDFLKGQTNLNVQFNYNGLVVSDLTEEIYLKQKRSEFRKPADGDKFVKKWNSDRTDSFEPKFLEQLNKGLKKIGLVATKNTPTNKYTMIVQTVKIEPGYYNGTSGNKRDTYVNLLIKFIETDKPEVELCTIKAEKIVGVTEEQMQMIETTMKINNAYANAAEKISKLIVKVCTQKEKVKEDPDADLKHDKKDKKDKKSKKSEDNQDE
jgi:hypothetical protein